MKKSGDELFDATVKFFLLNPFQFLPTISLWQKQHELK